MDPGAIQPRASHRLARDAARRPRRHRRVATLANGRRVVKVRVRAIAEGGEANRAVTELFAKELGCPSAMCGCCRSDLPTEAIAVDGDPGRLGEALRKLTAAKPD